MFVQERCDISDMDAMTALDDLYNAYLHFCKEKNIGVCKDSDLRNALKAMGFEHIRSRCPGNDMVIRRNAVSAFRGIRLRP